MTLKLPTLNYAEDALEPHISRQTVKTHYGKHTKKYFDTANELIAGTAYEGKELDELINKDSLTRMGSKLLNNVCQAYNHAFYWNCLAPDAQTGKPSNELLELIKDGFISFDEFKDKFTEAANDAFGSAWLWLYYRDGQLHLKTFPNAGNPLTTPKQIPLLVCDLWEHSWYLDHPADKKEYIKRFWNVINWNFVNDNLERATHE